MASSRLLTVTKLAPPRIGAESIARERLLALLQQARDARLSLVTGGAGFGKTTLLAQWRQEVMLSGRHGVWMALGRDDAGLPQFYAYLVAGLQGAGIPVEDESALAGGGADALSPAALGTSLVNALAQCGRELHVFIDDYHHVADARADQLVQFLAEHGPQGLCLVLASRTRPALALGKLRLLQEVVELDPSSMLFDYPETAAFLAASLGRPCSAGQMRLIHEHTGGWPAGLRLLALACRTRSPAALDLRTLLNRTGDLDAYLTEEVLTALPAQVVDFAERVALCRRFCPELAAALCEGSAPQAPIQTLEQGNLFIVRLEPVDRHDWYRFHALFADYLRQRLERRDPALVRRLHLQACRWHADQGMLGEAVRHAHRAGELDLAIELVEQAGLVGAMANLGPLLQWMESLPEALLAAHPRLLLQGCVALMLTARTEQARQWLEQLVASEAGRHPDVALAATIVRAAVALNRDDSPQAIAWLAPVQEQVTGLPLWQSLNATVLGTALVAAGRYAEARQLHQQLVTSVAGDRGDAIALLEDAVYALGFLAEGQVEEALRTAAATLARAEALQGRRSVSANVAAAFAADACYELNRLDEARDALAERLELFKHSSPEPMVRAAVCYGRLLRVQKTPRAALAFLVKTEEHFRTLGLQRGVASMLAEQAAIALSQGDHSGTARLQERLDAIARETAGQGGFLAEIAAIAALSGARLALALHTPEQALAQLAVVAQHASAAARGRLSVQAWLLEAEALGLQGRQDESTERFRQAVALGHRLGLIRTFLDAGAFVRGQLEQLASHEAWPPALLRYMDALLAAFDSARPPQSPPMPARPPGNGKPAAALTPRELEVLALMGQSMPNKRIASTLGLSVQTVKWNIKNIFAKLDVTSRYEAIAWARRHVASDAR